MPVGWELERPEVLEEAELLALLLRETDRSVLAFALYGSVADREGAVRFLKERLPLPVLEFTFSAQRKNPVRLLRQAPAGQRTCIFFYDAEEALPELTGFVNLQREAFAEAPHATVFWVREYGLREIATKAPDFWSWRSGVFDFRSEQAELSQLAMQVLLAEPSVFRGRADVERRVRLYRSLIQEYSGQDKPDDRFLARLLLRLAWLLEASGQVDEAEACAHDALERCGRAGDRHTEARSLHVLGVVAEDRWRLDEAEDLYHRGLVISQHIGDEGQVSAGYHQLGMIAQKRKRFDEAEVWYRKALAISERLGLEEIVAMQYHQLGRVAEERQRLDEAEQLYRKALEMNQRLGLDREAAFGYQQLGTIARKQQRLGEAAQLHRKALEIRQTLKLEEDTAASFRQLGMIAQERQRPEEAEQWYRKALEIFERTGHPPRTVSTLTSLGLLREQQGHPREAVGWLGRAFNIATGYRMPLAGEISALLARLFLTMGEAEFTSAWQQAFPGQEPPLELLRQDSETQ